MNALQLKLRIFSLIASLLLVFGFAQNAMAETIAVKSLTELKPYLEKDNVNIKLAPGEYTVTSDDASSGKIGKFWAGKEYLKNSFNVLLLEGKRLAHRFKEGANNKPLNFDAEDITFINYSTYPIVAGKKAMNIQITTCGTETSVIDNGVGTSVTYNKDCTPFL